MINNDDDDMMMTIQMWYDILFLDIKLLSQSFKRSMRQCQKDLLEHQAV